MAGVYRKLREGGGKIVTQCNQAIARKAAIQIARFLTSAAYNLVVEWVPQRPALRPVSRAPRAVEQATFNH
jgi:hypothetical protein